MILAKVWPRKMCEEVLDEKVCSFISMWYMFWMQAEELKVKPRMV